MVNDNYLFIINQYTKAQLREGGQGHIHWCFTYITRIM